jgi:hypothetical protein
MPDKALYWRGYLDALCEENGFTFSGTKNAVVYNTTEIECSISASNRLCSINSKIAYTGNAKIIAKYTSTEGSIFKSSSKAISGASETKVTSTMALYTISLSNEYIAVGTMNGSGSATKNMTIDALFIE